MSFLGEGSFYASTYLMKNDTAILSSQGYLMTNSTADSDFFYKAALTYQLAIFTLGIRFLFPLADDRVIRFKYYKVTDNMLLKGCCDSTANCPFVTERMAKITDFNSWKTASFICKSGTEKVKNFSIRDWKLLKRRLKLLNVAFCRFCSSLLMKVEMKVGLVWMI